MLDRFTRGTIRDLGRDTCTTSCLIPSTSSSTSPGRTDAGGTHSVMSGLRITNDRSSNASAAAHSRDMCSSSADRTPAIFVPHTGQCHIPQVRRPPTAAEVRPSASTRTRIGSVSTSGSAPYRRQPRSALIGDTNHRARNVANRTSAASGSPTS